MSSKERTWRSNNDSSLLMKVKSTTLTNKRLKSWLHPDLLGIVNEHLILFWTYTFDCSTWIERRSLQHISVHIPNSSLWILLGIGDHLAPVGHCAIWVWRKLELWGPNPLGGSGWCNKTDLQNKTPSQYLSRNTYRLVHTLANCEAILPVISMICNKLAKQIHH